MEPEETKLTDISELAQGAIFAVLADMAELRGGGVRRALTAARNLIRRPTAALPASFSKVVNAFGRGWGGAFGSGALPKGTGP